MVYILKVPLYNDFIINAEGSQMKKTARIFNPVKQAKAEAVTETLPRVCKDFNSKTCIELTRKLGRVSFIALKTKDMDVEILNESKFDEVYKPIPNSSALRAAKIYFRNIHIVGGSQEAVEALSLILSLSQKETEMATKKSAKKPAAKKPAAKKPAAKKPNSGDTKQPRESASQMFKELIMAGELTDDKIFEKVQKKYELDDNKKPYVKWYRNDLTKKGMNPPAAK